MKRIFFLMFVLLTLGSLTQTLAQSKPNKKLLKQLPGAWAIENVEAKVNENATEEERNSVMFVNLLASQLKDAETTYTFKKDGHYAFSTKSETTEGTWLLEASKLIVKGKTGELIATYDILIEGAALTLKGKGTGNIDLWLIAKKK